MELLLTNLENFSEEAFNDDLYKLCNLIVRNDKRIKREGTDGSVTVKAFDEEGTLVAEQEIVFPMDRDVESELEIFFDLESPKKKKKAKKESFFTTFGRKKAKVEEVVTPPVFETEDEVEEENERAQIPEENPVVNTFDDEMEETEEEFETVPCINCGQLLVAGAKLCPFCQAVQEQPNAPKEHVDQQIEAEPIKEEVTPHDGVPQEQQAAFESVQEALKVPETAVKFDESVSCIHCGATLNPSQKFCSECGAAQTEPEAETESVQEELQSVVEASEPPMATPEPELSWENNVAQEESVPAEKEFVSEVVKVSRQAPAEVLAFADKVGGLSDDETIKNQVMDKYEVQKAREIEGKKSEISKAEELTLYQAKQKFDEEQAQIKANFNRERSEQLFDIEQSYREMIQKEIDSQLKERESKINRLGEEFVATLHKMLAKSQKV
jgi:uncharacterized OB-fold protein